MRKKLIAGATSVVLVAAGVLAGTSLAQGDDPQDPGRVEIAAPIVAGKASEVKAAKRRTPTVQFFFARDATVPAQGASLVQGLKCPRGAGQPIGGGIRPAEGLVVSYLSVVNPQNNRIRKGVYWVGVRNESAPAGAGATAEIQCARNMKVIAR